MKKTLLLTLLLVWIGLSDMRGQSEYFEYEGVYYTIISEENKTVSTRSGFVGGSPGSPFVSGDVVLPSQVPYNGNTYTLVEIATRSFLQATDLESIVIPNSVCFIYEEAFKWCTSLKSVTIGNSVTSIGENAFSGCIRLRSLTFNDGDSSIELGYEKYNPSGDGKGLFVDCPLETLYLGRDYTVKNYSSSYPSDSYPSRYGYSPFANIKTLSEVTIGDNVTSLPSYFLYNCSGLTSVTIGNSVTEIGSYAFYYCSALKSATIPNSVTTIGNFAFYNCSDLTSLSIGNSVTEIGNYAFNGCSSLSSLTFEDGETRIELGYNDSSSGRGLFADCPLENIYIGRNLSYNSGSFYGYSPFVNIATLAEVTIGDNVTSVPDHLFYNCSGLTSIEIPNSVTSIGWGAFDGCSGLTSVTIGNSLTTIENNAFSGCKIETLNMDCYSIEDWFRGLKSLKTLTIGNSVNSIGNYAFYGCSGLTSVDIPSSVTSIGNSAFNGCNGLTSVTIGNSVTSIGENAFSGCSGLTSIEIPNSVTTIRRFAFSGCSGLTGMTIPNSVTVIEESTFSGCSGLKSIEIPNSVTSIGNSAFSGCSGLTSVTIGNAVNEIGIYAFNGCSSLSSLTFEDGETRIKLGYNTYSSSQTNGKGLFADCSLETLYLGRDYTIKDYSQSYPSNSYPSRYGYSPFANIKTLAEVTIGDNVTSLPSNFLLDCSGLTNVTISNSVTSIGDCAFSGCSSLRSLTFEDSDSSIELGYETYTFYGTGEGLFVDCPLETLYLGRDYKVRNYSSSYPTDSYPASYGYSPFANIKTLAEVTIGDNVTSLPNYFLYGCSGLTSLTIGNSVTSIGGSAFNGCSGLTSVDIPNSVTTIGNSAFNGSNGLTSVTIGNSVISIGVSAFNGCVGLTSVTIGNSVTSIGDSAFYGCVGLTSVDIPSSVTSIGNSAFYDCSGLTSVTIGNSVTSIGEYAFRGCTGLTSVEIPNSVTSIRNYTFNGCSSLSSLTFEDGESSITLGYNNYSSSSSSTGKGLFADCPLENIYIGRNLSYNSENRYGYSPFANITTLAGVTIGDNVTSLPNYLFYNCSGLTSVTIGNSVIEIGSWAFESCRGLKKVEISDLAAWCNIDFDNVYANPLYYAKHLYLDNEEITDLTIPEGVSSIKDYAFYDCSGLTSIEISNSVTEIGEYAFYGCQLTEIELLNITPPAYYSSFSSYSDMATLVIPDNTLSSYLATDWKRFLKIEEVDGDKAYIGNDDVFTYRFFESLREATLVQDNSYRNMRNVSIPDRVVCDLYETEEFYKVTTIGEGAFENCNLMTSLKLPSGLVSINRAAFSGCKGLQSIDLPVSVTSIGGSAFEGCSGLTSVIMGDSVTEIGNDAFNNCSGLKRVDIPDLEVWCNIDFDNNAANPLYNAEHLYLDNDEITDLTIPGGVTSIKNYAFYNCTGLSNLLLGDSITEIGDSVFFGCSGLTSVTIPNSVTEIGNDAFNNCSGLKRVNIADLAAWCNIDFGNEHANPLTYAKHLYLDNEEITDLTIPDGVPSIKTYTFNNCSDLASVTIGNSVTELESNAFNGCNGLTTVTIGYTIASIERDAFNGCINIQRLTFEDGMEDLTITDNTFTAKTLYVGRNLSGAYSFPNLRSLTIGGFVTNIPSNTFNKSTLTSVTINPGAEVVIETGAFSGCSNLNELVLPEDITEIGANAFSGTGLKNIIVPGGVIAENAFAGCNLDNITLGANVESIGEYAFDGSNAIKNVYATPTTPPAAQNNTFSYYEAQLWVPEEALDTYYNFTRCWYRFNGKPLVCPENLIVEGQAIFNGKPGETFQLTATITPSNVTLDRVLWRSTNPAVATVDNNGLVTIHNFQFSDESMARAGEEGFCQIIASTLYEDSPVAVVNIEALTTSIEYINSEDMSAGTSAAFDQNDIYTLQGVCVKRQASQSDIDALAPGIYIIGGKKVIVK